MDNKYKFACRVCLIKNPSSKMRSFADQLTREMFIECTSVLVVPGDKYPQQLCMKCWKKCSSWFSFRMLARNIDRQLRLENDVDNEEKVGDGEALIVIREGETNVKKEPLDEETDITVEKKKDVQLMEGGVYIEGYSAETEVEEEEEVESEINDPLAEDRIEEGGTATSKAMDESEIHKSRPSFDTLSDLNDLKQHKNDNSKKRTFKADESDKNCQTKVVSKLIKNTPSKIQQSEDFTRKIVVAQRKLANKWKTFNCDDCHRKFLLRRELNQHVQQEHL